MSDRQISSGAADRRVEPSHSSSTNPLVDGINVGSIRLFLAAAELGSVARAAKRLHLAQPSAVAKLRKLERQLGVSLLVRSPTGSVMTAAGSLLAPISQEALSSLERMVGLAHLARHQDVHLSLGVTATVQHVLLDTWLRTAAMNHVVVDLVEMDTRSISARIRAGQLPFGFIDGPEPPLGINSRIVASVELIAVVAPNHGWANRNSHVTADELVAGDIIIRRADSGTRDFVDQAFSGRRFSPDSKIEVASNAAARATALTGAGIALLPRRLIQADLDHQRLIELPIRGLDLRQPIRALWVGTQPAHTAARALLDEITAAEPVAM